MNSTTNIAQVDARVNFLAWSIVSCLLFFGIRGPKHEHYAPFSNTTSRFDSGLWQNPTYYGPTDNTFMLDDFLYRNRLVGMTRKHIHEKLGNTALATQAVETFLISSGGCSLEWSYLEVQFDPHSSVDPELHKIDRYRIVTEKGKLNGTLIASNATDWFDR